MRLCQTHLQTNTKLPTKDWRANFVVVRVCNQLCNKLSISDKRSALIDTVKSIVLTSTPELVNNRGGGGGQDLSADFLDQVSLTKSWAPGNEGKHLREMKFL